MINENLLFLINFLIVSLCLLNIIGKNFLIKALIFGNVCNGKQYLDKNVFNGFFIN